MKHFGSIFLKGLRWNGRIARVVVYGTLGLGIGLGAANAETKYPSRPIRLVVPYNPGGIADTLARALAEGLHKELGQPVVVENKAGANTAMGAAAVAKGPGDGYQILLATPATLVLNPLLLPHLAYAPKDLAEVYIVATAPMALTVKKDSQISNFEDLINAIRKSNGGVAFASTGVGSSAQLVGELLQMETKTSMIHAPYNGSGPALTAVMAGEVLLATDNVASAIGMYSAGRLKPIAVTSKNRTPFLPDVPTLYELGFRSFDVSTWYGVVVSAKTSPEIVGRLNQAIARVAQDRGFVSKFARQGLEIKNPHAPEDFKTFVNKERSLWTKIIKERNITIN